MTEQQERWNTERTQRHARWAKIGSRVVYAPFARQIMECLAPSKGESPIVVVDLGTGSGLLTVELSKLLPRAKIIGLDPSSEMLKAAQKHAEQAGMSDYEARLGQAEEMPIESNSVDLVVSQSSLHEWGDPQKGLSEIFRVLKPGGSLILKDYNRGWLSTWKRHLLKLLDHLEMFKFTFEEVADLLREADFDEIKGQGRGLQWFVQAPK